MNNYDVVVKLIGPIRPVGETETDNIRLRNLMELSDLVHELVSDIHDVLKDRYSHMASVSKAGQKAEEILGSLRDYCPDLTSNKMKEG